MQIPTRSGPRKVQRPEFFRRELLHNIFQVHPKQPGLLQHQTLRCLKPWKYRKWESEFSRRHPLQLRKTGLRFVFFGQSLLDYKVSEFFHSGFIYKGLTASYRLSNENYFDYFRIQEGDLKIFGDFYLTKNFVINLEAGQTVARQYGPGFLNEEETVIDFNDGFLIKAGLYYRMWLNK